VSRPAASRPQGRYNDPGFRRLALAPGLLCGVILLAGIALIGLEFYIAVRLLVAILALIMGVFAVQARHWWWLPPLAAIAVLWNPVLPIELPEPWLFAAHYVAIPVVVVAGILIKVPHQEETPGRRR